MGTGAGSEAHPGLDIAVRSGTPIRAAGGGVVAEAGVDPDYGRYVLINHPQGYQSMYGHASRVLVTAGEAVKAGQVIGLSGSTGRSTAPHLHFEIRRNGQQIDPRSLISEPRL
jgi:murein DD-endopeptidase MepM/ murein hydrolase activator NlpD